MLLRFLSAFSYFNSHSIGNIKTPMGLLDDECHIKILKGNLDEEMGEYDEETLLACGNMGILRKNYSRILWNLWRLSYNVLTVNSPHPAYARS